MITLSLDFVYLWLEFYFEIARHTVVSHSLVIDETSVYEIISPDLPHTFLIYDTILYTFNGHWVTSKEVLFLFIYNKNHGNLMKRQYHVPIDHNASWLEAIGG